jgi:hypothetical protein
MSRIQQTLDGRQTGISLFSPAEINETNRFDSLESCGQSVLGVHYAGLCAQPRLCDSATTAMTHRELKPGFQRMIPLEVKPRCPPSTKDTARQDCQSVKRKVVRFEEGRVARTMIRPIESRDAQAASRW